MPNPEPRTPNPESWTANPDVVVIGGGPAGSTVSTLLAKAGVSVELFERETFPRFHIGESLIPETYWVLKDLDMLPKMQASHFVKKYSVQFVNSEGRESAPFYFWDQQAARVLADVAGGAQRVRPDDAGERPRARRQRPRGRSRVRRDLRGRSSRRREDQGRGGASARCARRSLSMRVDRTGC
jgi:choline dehydrogenase-like flavoprotein